MATLTIASTDYLSVGQAAHQIGARPQDVTDAIYKQKLSNTICPLVGGRRVIPRSYLNTVREVLAGYGKVVASEVLR